jgi:hypothetical protein
LAYLPSSSTLLQSSWQIRLTKTISFSLLFCIFPCCPLIVYVFDTCCFAWVHVLFSSDRSSTRLNASSNLNQRHNVYWFHSILCKNFLATLYLKQSNWSQFLEILSNNILRSQIFLLWLLLRWKNLILRLKNSYDLNIPVKLFVLLFFWKSKKKVEIHNKLEVIFHRSEMARKDRDAIIKIQMTVRISNQCVCLFKPDALVCRYMHAYSLLLL